MPLPRYASTEYLPHLGIYEGLIVETEVLEDHSSGGVIYSTVRKQISGLTSTLPAELSYHSRFSAAALELVPTFSATYVTPGNRHLEWWHVQCWCLITRMRPTNPHTQTLDTPTLGPCILLPHQVQHLQSLRPRSRIKGRRGQRSAEK